MMPYINKMQTSKANDAQDNPKLTDVLRQLAPHIGATMLALSLLGSLIYAKLIAKPFSIYE